MIHYKLYLLILLFLGAAAQEELQLKEVVRVSLTNNETVTYTLNLTKDNQKGETDLFIFAEPLVLIPSQIPILTISLDNGSNVKCFAD